MAGVRHEGSVRLAGRGVYAIVNKKGPVPSGNATHLAYHLTHPSTPVALQEGLGIHTASSFVIQVKNPLADASTYDRRVGISAGRRAQYPDAILDHVFERGSRGQHEYGLRFTTCRCIELLEYEGAELLMIAARSGVAGSDASLGEHRGEGASVRTSGIRTQWMFVKHSRKLEKGSRKSRWMIFSGSWRWTRRDSLLNHWKGSGSRVKMGCIRMAYK